MREREEDYKWALECLKEIYIGTGFHRLQIVVSDGDPGLANAIAIVFPDATHLLCRWYHNQNVYTNCSKFFAIIELWEAF